MELTGKCKEEFEKWLVCGGGKETFEKYYEDDDNIYDTYDWFDKHSTSMQYGVYVDFFDSVGQKIHISYSEGLSLGGVEGFYYTIDYRTYNKVVDTRQEAREQAITKANEIYNDANR